MSFELQKELLETNSERISNLDIEQMVYDAIECAIGGMILTNLEGTIVYINRAGLFMFDYPSRGELLGKSVADLFHSKAIDELIDITEKVDTGISEFRVLKKSGDTIYVTLVTSPIYDVKGNQKGQMISLFDITYRKNMELALLQKDKELEELNKQLKALASTDPLTGLANRRTYDAHLASEWRRCKRNKVPLSIMVIDIDYFKNYNDFYGHKEGDRCLIKVADVIQKAAGANREGDLVARYGGEEFVVLLSGADEKAIFEKALAVKREMHNRLIHHEKTGVENRDMVTLSIGVATELTFSSSASTLFEHGDLALYQAKKGGRDTICQYFERVV